jgi:FlaA1/EpsC-like NDP-sugar epimerase
MIKNLINLENIYSKKTFLIIFDIILIAISFYLSFFLRMSGDISEYNDVIQFIEVELLLFLVIVHLIFSLANGLYSMSIQNFGIHNFKELVSQSIALSFALIVFVILNNIFFPRLIYLIFFLVLLSNLFLFRVSLFLILKLLNKNEKIKSIAIFGAGQLGKKLFSAYEYSLINVECFIETEKYYINSNLFGKKVLDINEFLNKKIKVDEIWIAKQKINKKNLLKIQKKFTENNYKSFIFNDENFLLNNFNKESFIQELFYDKNFKIKKNLSSLKKEFNNKKILITGAGGSIGKEICNQLSEFNYSKLIFIDHNESSMFELSKNFGKKKNIKFIIGSVADKKSMEEIFKSQNFDLIIHAAAHKHVGLSQLDYNLKEFIQNNIGSTMNICVLAKKFQSKKVLLISSDKAVNPTNIMGMTKRICEIIILYFTQIKNSKTHFSFVRFGNVIGSSGSVLPIFIDQIKSGGPIYVRGKNIERYFMSIEEAVHLVLSSLLLKKNAYCLDMGEQYKIINIAKSLIKDLGYTEKNEKNKNGDIKIEIVKPLNGEKISEELNYSFEKLIKSKLDKVFSIDYNLEIDIKITDKIKNLLNNNKINKKNFFKIQNEIIKTFKK